MTVHLLLTCRGEVIIVIGSGGRGPSLQMDESEGTLAFYILTSTDTSLGKSGTDDGWEDNVNAILTHCIPLLPCLS